MLAHEELGPARAVARDEEGQVPARAYALLDEARVFAACVPAELGGELRRMDELLATTRALAAKDLTVTIGYFGSRLGATAAWVAASEPLGRKVAGHVLAGARIPLALTERAHGGDLLACEVRAEPDGDGFRLSGEKWLVNSAGSSELLVVFARTKPEGGPRGFSLLLVDRRELAPGSWRPLDRVRTHGLRGADVSGVVFEGARVPRDALVGPLGGGLEATVKALQVSRTLVSGFSLGGGDAALRTTLDFARARTIGGQRVLDHPYPRALLAGAFADLLSAGAVATFEARRLHVAPEQASISSAVAKAFVPPLVDDVVASLATVLGARFYLREEHAHGLFQKVLRDVAVVSLFDGSTVVNLHGLARELPLVVERRARAAADPHVEERLRACCSSGGALPGFDPRKLELTSRGQDDATAGIGLAALQVARAPLDPALRASLARLVGRVKDELDRFALRFEEDRAREGARFGRSPAAFELARRYADLHAAAATAHFVLGGAPWERAPAWGELLALALVRRLDRDAWTREPVPDAWIERATAELIRRHDANAPLTTWEG